MNEKKSKTFDKAPPANGEKQRFFKPRPSKKTLSQRHRRGTTEKSRR
jgi:hypothetical protein